MERMLPVKRTEFFNFHLFTVKLLVLGHGIVLPLALLTNQSNLVSHETPRIQKNGPLQGL